MFTRVVVLVGALTLIPAGTALAAATGRDTQLAAATGENTPLHLGAATTAHASSGNSGILRTIIALLVVVVLIYAVARVLRAVKGRDAHAHGDGLKHLSTLPLGGGRSIALVRSGTDIVLVGVSEQGVTPIKTYTEAEAIANGIDVPHAADPGQSEERPFGEVLDRLRRMTVRP